ncbi:uncharacterized protein LOC143377240 [Andrena cerasifolii]|uniref:uncharacterized protein LOC143377240 n=1 Tax=Andrena cerasifolii TaxID=2819439 RepID=UPI0040377093
MSSGVWQRALDVCHPISHVHCIDRQPQCLQCSCGQPGEQVSTAQFKSRKRHSLERGYLRLRNDEADLPLAVVAADPQVDHGRESSFGSIREAVDLNGLLGRSQAQPMRNLHVA